jgi:F-type H+-transporting ATPase subunit gamma
MLGIRTIKRKIRAVQNIKKITKAMEVVSATKMKKIQQQLLNAKPYFEGYKTFLEAVFSRESNLRHPYLFNKEESVGKGRKLLVVISADKGLCGSYSTNIFRHFKKYVHENKDVLVLTIGRKIHDFSPKEGIKPIASLYLIPAIPQFSKVKTFLFKEIISRYDKGEIKEVKILYTQFVNAMTFRPRLDNFLPLDFKPTGKPEKEKSQARDWILEPAPEEMLEHILPKYVAIYFYQILLTSLASEHAARMNAMRNATDNADELLSHLTLTYNKARQASITKELLDIVGGAEALKG